jgi:DNA (cytosine-5)-methyltransferase 1
MVLVSLVEYAKKHNKSGDTLRRLAENGALRTAQKIGRNWVVESEEEYPVKKRSANKKPPITVVSMFAGCGGMDLGFVGGFDFLGKHYERTNFDIIWANEINTAACETYRRNLGEHIVVGDINDKIDDMPTYADVVIGGFPCQDISINGKMKGIHGERSSLYTAIVEAVKRLQPKAFIAENVGGLLLKQNEYSLKKILEDFGALGYNISYQLYHAADYGVPQTRERVFIVGTRKDLPSFIPPEPTCTKHITAKEAISDLESLEADNEFSHIWSKAKVSGEQGNRRLLADRPGYTIRAECHGNIQFHYSLPRRISMREAARIQSFPDNFRFSSGLRETERQIGNAVPPVLAWHIAKSVELAIRGKSIEKSRVRSVVGQML